ncbi:hypothetical protein LguiA_029532 [Lonicera macranthoides]
MKNEDKRKDIEFRLRWVKHALFVYFVVFELISVLNSVVDPYSQKVFVSPFMGVFVLLPIGYGGLSRVVRIGVEMSRSTSLGGDLTQSYEDLYLLVRWHFGVNEDSFRKASFGRLFMIRGMSYGYLSLMSPRFFKGLGFLAMSTPPVLYKSTDTCSEYKPKCIGHTQKVLFYTALALIAVGISGHVVTLQSFYEQNKSNTKNENETKILWQALGLVGVVLVAVIGGIALPYIRPWALRFGIPAICALVATLLFLSGSCQYRHVSPEVVH